MPLLSVLLLGNVISPRRQRPFLVSRNRGSADRRRSQWAVWGISDYDFRRGSLRTTISARRMIIQNAVRLIKPRPADRSGRLKSASLDSDYQTLPAERPVEISAVLGLEPFERIVYVMTVLEHYSDHECSLLLGWPRREVLPARTRAFEGIGRQMEMQDRQLPMPVHKIPGCMTGPAR